MRKQIRVIVLCFTFVMLFINWSQGWLELPGWGIPGWAVMLFFAVCFALMLWMNPLDKKKS